MSASKSDRAVRETLLSRLRSLGQAAASQRPDSGRVGTDEEHLGAAIEWLYRSQDVTDCSGSAATYNLFLGWEDPYPETTGYIIPTLYRYAEWSGDTEAADRATEMARWLLEVQHDQGSFPGGTGTEGPPNVFNTGQVVFGLAAAYERTDNRLFRDAVARACEWLVDVQSPDGPWRAYDYRGETHTYTTRVGWALLVGSEVVEDDFGPAAHRLFDWAIANQRANGWFDRAAFGPDETPFLHTIAYTVRGLLEGGVLLDSDELVESARVTADALLRLQSDGPLRGAYGPDWESTWYYCLTGNAQMGLVWTRLFELTGDPAYLTAARDAVQFLKRHHRVRGPKPIQGGIPGSYPFFGRYLYFRYPNWATKFFADALLRIDDETGVESPETRPSGPPGTRSTGG